MRTRTLVFIPIDGVFVRRRCYLSGGCCHQKQPHRKHTLPRKLEGVYRRYNRQSAARSADAVSTAAVGLSTFSISLLEDTVGYPIKEPVGTGQCYRPLLPRTARIPV